MLIRLLITATLQTSIFKEIPITGQMLMLQVLLMNGKRKMIVNKLEPIGDYK